MLSTYVIETQNVQPKVQYELEMQVETMYQKKQTHSTK